MHYSTGAANAAWASGVFSTDTGLNYGVIDLLSGPMPTDADNAQSGTLLARITASSGAWVAGTHTNGLQYSAPVGGVIGILGGQTFSGVALATGTVGYARMKGNPADDNAAIGATKFVRIDLTVSAGGGAECNLSHIDLTAGETVTINSIAITQPRS
jgi:hypothetical protein